MQHHSNWYEDSERKQNSTKKESSAACSHDTDNQSLIFLDMQQASNNKKHIISPYLQK
jgi:hypothetical protein